MPVASTKKTNRGVQGGRGAGKGKTGIWKAKPAKTAAKKATRKTS